MRPNETATEKHRSISDNADISHALGLIVEFLRTEENSSRQTLQAQALRRLVELNSEPNLVRRRCISAAFGLHAAGLRPNAGDIAWLVRDSVIGFPQQPSFEF